MVRGNGFKLNQDLFRSDIRKNIFTGNVVKQCRVVGAPSLEIFKVRLNKALSNLIQLQISQLIAMGLELDDL